MLLPARSPISTRHKMCPLQVQRNKTDKNDARGLAHLVRSGWFRPVHLEPIGGSGAANHWLGWGRKMDTEADEVRHSSELGALITRLAMADLLFAGVIVAIAAAWIALAAVF
jgi:hypothetical protein